MRSTAPEKAGKYICICFRVEEVLAVRFWRSDRWESHSYMPSSEMKIDIRIFQPVEEALHELISSLRHRMITTKTIMVGQLA